jgi:PHD/YefM family antitoxin component YafN of YafNO toxin-antitoxin module
MLTNRGRPTAILVSPDRWNALIELVDDLECGLAALQTELTIAKGDDRFDQLAPAEVKEWLSENPTPAPTSNF